uniref:Uncharacterized protein n=1 Tax=Rhizophora mucronata TaxID=61149 RepID=A0A2P2NFL8_RHIMU
MSKKLYKHNLKWLERLKLCAKYDLLGNFIFVYVECIAYYAGSFDIYLLWLGLESKTKII